MKVLRSNWFISMLVAVIILIVVGDLLLNHYRKKNTKNTRLVPDINAITDPKQKEQIIYGKELIANTAKFLGPHGIISSTTNGLNCQNCHLDAGSKIYANNFLAVASTYPKFRARSGRVESIEFRINECLERSLNGKKIDSLSREMVAMVSYIKWVGQNVHKQQPPGVATPTIPFLERAADPVKGQTVYVAKCMSCHGKNGEGSLSVDSLNFLYPPLWGSNSYAVSAGMYRIIKLSTYIRNNMPPGSTYTSPQLVNEESWDVAAYINSQPHPEKMFAYDWPDISTKPEDYPFGPYKDGFNEVQHKYGPFPPITKVKKK